jgi:hypothetical protein
MERTIAAGVIFFKTSGSGARVFTWLWQAAQFRA